MRSEKENLYKSKKDLKTCITTQKILQRIAQETEEIAHGKITAIVTKCLKIIFGENAYEFRFVFKRKRGRTWAVPQLLKVIKENKNDE